MDEFAAKRKIRMKMRHGVYEGPQERLFGQGALLRNHPTDASKYLAQFDDTSLVEAFGWHEFNRADFSGAKDIHRLDLVFGF